MADWLPLPDYRLLPAVSGLYVIRHRTSGKQYVGQSQNIRKRMPGHLGATQKSGYLPAAIRKHGAEAFEVCIWQECSPAELGEAERALIAALGTFAPAGYNASLGGLGPSGVVMSAEWRARQSAQRKGVPLTIETRQKIRESALANNAFKGRKHTAETRAKMAAAAAELHTGKVRSAEVRANISASLKGRAAPVLSAETREKIAAAHRGVANPKKALPGEKNGMHGVRGGQHPSARVVSVWEPEGLAPKIFSSATEASAALGCSRMRVCDYCKGRRRDPAGRLVYIEG